MESIDILFLSFPRRYCTPTQPYLTNFHLTDYIRIKSSAINQVQIRERYCIE